MASFIDEHRTELGVESIFRTLQVAPPAAASAPTTGRFPSEPSPACEDGRPGNPS